MTLLFISKRGEGLGLATRCAGEGYTISLYVEDEDAAFVGNGIVNKSTFPKHILNPNQNCIASNINQLLALEKPDIVITTSLSMGRVSDYLREQGVPTFGSSHWADTISNGGGYSREIMKRIGIGVWDGEEGVGVSCGAWWNGFRFISPYISFNEDRFLTGSLGPSIQTAGNVARRVSPDSKMFLGSVESIGRLLKKTKFKGNISLSCVATRKKLLCVSFTTSSLFFPSLLESYKGSVTELLSAIVSGQEPKGRFTEDYTLSIPISIPPYPHRSSSENSGVNIGGVCLSNLRHLYLMEVKKEGDEYVSAGSELMVVSARGRDVNEARKRAYKTISNLSINNIQYRIDIGDRVPRDEDMLKEWGYLE